YIARHRNFGMQRMRAKHPGLEDSIQFWTPELCARSPEIFDFVVTLGGDGTVLYTSWLFQTTVPPIIPFHLGSLGFLTVFDHRHARRVLDAAIRAGVRINLRMRFTCTVYRLAEEVDPARANVLVAAADCNRLISHEIATHGLQSGDERLCTADGDDDGDDAAGLGFGQEGLGRGARPARSFSQKRKPSGSASAFSAAAGPAAAGAAGSAPTRVRPSASRTHLRKRSSANHSSNSEPRSSSDSDAGHARPAPRRMPSAGAVPRLSRKSSTFSARPAAAATTASAGSSAKKAAPSRRTSEEAAPEGVPSPLLEAEWDDVPKAYQRRVRKVWKRDSTFQVMNEVVVDRGPSPYLAQIELYGDGTHLTTVEADGLCLATPTGSTAYSLAAGGSLVHPEIPAILVTPICAHTLSFRPMLLPDSMVLRVVLPPDSRDTVWASFDGRHRIELRRGDHIQITASKYPLPTVCASQSQTQDWMSSLSRCLNWNERKRQKQFTAPGAGGLSDDGSDEGVNAADEGSAAEEEEEPDA
ncbi:hypothetical protein H4R23_004593, partial [Coemansia sp. Cherry 401B]